jgi:hypothetical protein
MKNECMIIKDLLPLYVENLVSDETREFMETHLNDCSDCRKALEGARIGVEKTGDACAVPLKNIKKNLIRQKFKSILLAVLSVMIVLITGFGYLTTPQYVPYSEDPLSVLEKEDGSIIISFDKDKVTGFAVNDVDISEDGNEAILYVHTWKTTWDHLFMSSEIQDVTLKQEDSPLIKAIYYSPNNYREAIKIWGNDIGYQTIELPRLALVYYLMMAGFAVLLSGVLLFFFRKNPKVKAWIIKITLLPLAYIISHLITKGFSTITYSMERDLIFILLVTVLLYAVGLVGLNLYRNKKNDVKL